MVNTGTKRHVREWDNIVLPSWIFDVVKRVQALPRCASTPFLHNHYICTYLDDMVMCIVLPSKTCYHIGPILLKSIGECYLMIWIQMHLYIYARWLGVSQIGKHQMAKNIRNTHCWICHPQRFKYFIRKNWSLWFSLIEIINSYEAMCFRKETIFYSCLVGNVGHVSHRNSLHKRGAMQEMVKHMGQLEKQFIV